MSFGEFYNGGNTATQEPANASVDANASVTWIWVAVVAFLAGIRIVFEFGGK